MWSISHPFNVIKVNLIDADTGLTLIAVYCCVTSSCQYPIINGQGSEHLVSTNGTWWHQGNRVSESVCTCDANDISSFALQGTNLGA